MTHEIPRTVSGPHTQHNVTLIGSIGTINRTSLALFGTRLPGVSAILTTHNRIL